MRINNRKFYYYWRMQKNGELIGPTFTPFCEEKLALNQIKKIMKIDELPSDFQLICSLYSDRSCACPSTIENATMMSISSIKKELKTDPLDLLKKVLINFPHTLKITPSGIWPEMGSIIYTKVSHHSVKFESNDNIYNLNDPQQVKNFTSELEKRILDRIKRQKTNKNIKSRTTTIGWFEHNITDIIQQAKFMIYLDHDNLIKANPYLIGTIKLYKKTTKNVMFDIDNRKILTRDGKEEIKADNVGQVIDNLIKCLASTKG